MNLIDAIRHEIGEADLAAHPVTQLRVSANAPEGTVYAVPRLDRAGEVEIVMNPLDWQQMRDEVERRKPPEPPVRVDALDTAPRVSRVFGLPVVEESA